MRSLSAQPSSLAKSEYRGCCAGPVAGVCVCERRAENAEACEELQLVDVQSVYIIVECR